MKQEDRIWDFVVVGGGIAGLAIAELLSRSGWGVALIEKNAKVCQEASAEQHGWFHFGSLYSIFPNNQYMRTLVGGIDDLLAYYSQFPGMNITVNGSGKLEFPGYEGSWFCERPIEYIVCARNDPDFDLRSFDGLNRYLKKLFFLASWEFAIKQFISRHQRFHKFDWRSGQASQWIPKAGWADYSREVISKPENRDIRLDVDTHFRVIGFDRPMNSHAIISDLLRSFLTSGGSLVLNETVISFDTTKGVHTRVVTEKRKYTTKGMVVCAGKWLRELAGERVKLKVVVSPLLVTFPAVCDSHFVRLTPFVEKSINHLLHTVNGVTYSVIGGGYYADPEDHGAVLRAKEQLVCNAKAVFPRLACAQVRETYVGYKTEVAPEKGERNYQYFIRHIGEGVYTVIPGKFSLAFSLAVNFYKRVVGGEPSVRVTCGRDIDPSPFISMTRHAEIVAKATGSVVRNRETQGRGFD